MELRVVNNLNLEQIEKVVTGNPFPALAVGIGSGIPMESARDLMRLGKRNWQALFNYWKRQQEWLQLEIDGLRMILDQINDLSFEDMIKLAGTYGTPAIPKRQIGVPTDSKLGIEAPLNDASILRGDTDTSYCLCGWCEACDWETKYSNCATTGYCRLNFGKNRTLRRFDSRCQLTASSAVFDQVRSEGRQRLEYLLHLQSRLTATLNTFLASDKNYRDKPVLPQYRQFLGDAWCKVGDEVLLYMPSFAEFVSSDKVIFKGKVTEVRAEGAWRKEIRVQNGYSRPWLPLDDPGIFLEEEVSSLLRSVEYRRLWLRGTTSRTHFNQAQLAEILKGI